MTSVIRASPAPRADLKRFVSITTRWMDNDVHGYLNNVVYYSLFDTTVNQFLIEHGALDIHRSEVIGVVVHSSCDYFSSVAYPAVLSIGLSVTHIGKSNVRYRLAVFQPDAETCSVLGEFTHVYVERASYRPVPHSERFAALLRRLLADTSPPTLT